MFDRVVYLNVLEHEFIVGDWAAESRISQEGGCIRTEV